MRTDKQERVYAIITGDSGLGTARMIARAAAELHCIIVVEDAERIREHAVGKADIMSHHGMHDIKTTASELIQVPIDVHRLYDGTKYDKLLQNKSKDQPWKKKWKR